MTMLTPDQQQARTMLDEARFWGHLALRAATRSYGGDEWNRGQVAAYRLVANHMRRRACSLDPDLSALASTEPRKRTSPTSITRRAA